MLKCKQRTCGKSAPPVRIRAALNLMMLCRSNFASHRDLEILTRKPEITSPNQHLLACPHRATHLGPLVSARAPGRSSLPLHRGRGR